MSLRPFRLPNDLTLMVDLLPKSFQYPENPEWSLQEDETENFLSMVNTARRLWPLFSVLFKTSPSLRDALHGFIWEEDGTPAGMVNISRDGSTDDWAIANVGVLPEFRRRGIARKLVEAAIGLAREHRAEHILLDVISGNTPAYDLYVALGFAHFSSSTTLLHDAPTAATPDCPMPKEYTITRLATTHWQPFYELARRVTPSDVQAFRPVTVQSFRNSPMLNLVIRLLNTFSGARELGLVVRDGKEQQVVATANITAQTRGTGMNVCRIVLDPEHTQLAPPLVSTILSTSRQLSPRNRVECRIDNWQPKLIDAATSSGFKRQYEYHRLGMKLS